MKQFVRKAFILAFVAAFLSLPRLTMAGNTTLYGDFRYSANAIKEDGVGSDIDGLQGRDNVSLFGVKGEYGDSIKVFFNLQTGAPTDGNGGHAFEQRFFMGGLKGSFGKVEFGRMTNAYKMPGFAMDPFYNLSHINTKGVFSSAAGAYGLSPATDGFTDNALQYETPSFSGVKLIGGVYMDDSNNNQHGYLLGGSFSTEDLTIGVVGALDDGDADGITTIPNVAVGGYAARAYATYKQENWKAGVSFEQLEQKNADDINYLYVTGTMMVPDINTDFSASLGWVSEGAAKGVGFTAGAFYNVLKNAQLFAIVSYANLSDTKPAVAGDQDASPMSLSIGASYKFSISAN